MPPQRKKTFLALLLFCALALFVDRVLLPSDSLGPQRVAGSEGLGRAQEPADAADAARGETLIPELPFPFEVRNFSVSRLSRDPFARPSPQSGRGVGSQAGDAMFSESSIRGKLDRASFLKRYRLDGVMQNEQTRLAIVGGFWIRIGESIRGCRLVSIEGRDVSFTCFDGVAVLHFSHEPREAGN